MDDVPIRASVGRDGHPQTFEELLARKLGTSQHPASTTANQRSAPSHSSPSSSSSYKSTKRVSFTGSTRSPLSRSQRLGLTDDDSAPEESKEDGNYGAEDELDEYRRIEDTLRTLRVEAEMEAMDDSKYADEEEQHVGADKTEQPDSADDADATLEHDVSHSAYAGDAGAEGLDESEAADVSARQDSAESAEERLRRQRMDAFNSYARSAKPLKTKREDNPEQQPHYQHSPSRHNDSLADADVAVVHASAISPAIAQLFFQPPASAHSSPHSLSSGEHSRSESAEWGVGSGYGKGRARVSASEKPASKQTGKRLQPQRANHYLTSSAANTTAAPTSTAASRTSTSTSPFTSTPSVTNTQSLPSALHAQLNTLQQETAQYQAERARLVTLQHETQRELHLIKAERQQLTARLAQQKAEWDKQRGEEERRLKRERLELERRRREAAGWKGSVREEKGRVDELEAEWGRREREWKEREGKYKATIERMRREVREMQAEVKEVRERELMEERRRVG